MPLPQLVCSNAFTATNSALEVSSHTYFLCDSSVLHPPTHYASSSTSVSDVIELGTYSEEVQSPEWLTTMAEELDCLSWTHTWDLISLPSHAIPITCRWIYWMKTCSKGSLLCYKAFWLLMVFSRSMITSMMRLLPLWPTCTLYAH